MMADPDMRYLRDELLHIYSNFYVNYVVKNLLYEMGTPIQCELFVKGLHRYISGIPQFK